MNISPSGGLTLESPEYALHIIELGGELSVEDGSSDSSFARWIDRVRAQFPEASEACSPTAAAEPGAAPAEPVPR